MQEHPTLDENATQVEMEIASLAQQIDAILHTEKNHASLARQAGLGTGSCPKLSRFFVRLLKAMLGVFAPQSIAGDKEIPIQKDFKKGD